MVSATAKITVDPQAVSMAAAIRTAAESAPLVTLTGRALADLAAELGDIAAAAQFLTDLATEVGRPISVNLPTGRDTSSTVSIAPRSWSQERLKGWIAGHHAELEYEFDEAVRAKSEAVPS